MGIYDTGCAFQKNQKIKIKFNSQDNGACPHCKKIYNCTILANMRKLLYDSVNPYSDDIMELVIYRCPEFKS